MNFKSARPYRLLEAGLVEIVREGRLIPAVTVARVPARENAPNDSTSAQG